MMTSYRARARASMSRRFGGMAAIVGDEAAARTVAAGNLWIGVPILWITVPTDDDDGARSGPRRPPRPGAPKCGGSVTHSVTEPPHRAGVPVWGLDRSRGRAMPDATMGP